MSLVKKFQEPSGPIDKNALNDALNNELSTFNLKSKDERKVREALVKLRDHMDTQGNVFSADQLAKQYTVTGPGSQGFEGSPDQVRSNWFSGKLKIQDDKDAMSVAAAIYDKASKEIKNPTISSTNSTPAGTNPVKEQLGILNINNHIVDKVYGGPETFSSIFDAIKDDGVRKGKVMPAMTQLLKDYINTAETHQGTADYVDLEKAKEALSAIEVGGVANWDRIAELTYPLKWNINDFLMKEGDHKLIAENQAAATQKTEEDALRGSFDNLKRLGFQHDLAENLIRGGYTESVPISGINYKGKDVSKELNTYLKNKNAVSLRNPTTSQWLFIDPATGTQVNESGQSFDPYNPLYQFGWEHNPNSFAMTPKTGVYKQQDFGDVGVWMPASIPGHEGWMAYGYSPKSTPESRDYGHTVVITKGNERKTLKRGTDGKYHLNSEDGEIVPIQIRGIHPNRRYDEKINEYGVPELFLSKPSLSSEKVYQLEQMFQEKLKQATGMLTQKNGKEFDSNDIQTLRDVIKHLRYKSGKASGEELKTIMKNLSALENLLELNHKGIIGSLKVGGILKAQTGAELELNKYAKPLPNVTGVRKDSDQKSVESRDISGLWRGASGLDKTILLSNAAMLAPGITGVTAGLFSTGLEAYRDANDEDGFTLKDWGNLGLNLGLSAAAFVGFGGLKAGKIGVEIAKTALGANKLTKVAAKGAKEVDSLLAIKKLATGQKEIKTSLNIINKFAKEADITSKSLSEIGKLAGVANKPKVVQEVIKVQSFAKTLANAPSLLPSVSGLGAKTLQKATTYGQYAAMAAGAWSTLDAVPAVYKLATKGFDEMTINDYQSMVNVAFGVKAGKHVAKVQIGKRYGVVPRGTAGTDKLVAEIKGAEGVKPTTHKLSSPEAIAKFKETSLRPGSGKVKKQALKELFVKDINKGITDATKHITIADVGDVNLVKATKVTGTKLRTAYSPDKNLWLQDKGMEWAKTYGLALPGKTTRGGIPGGKRLRTNPYKDWGPVNRYGPSSKYHSPSTYGPSSKYGPPEAYGPSSILGSSEAYGPSSILGSSNILGPSNVYGSSSPVKQVKVPKIKAPKATVPKKAKATTKPKAKKTTKQLKIDIPPFQEGGILKFQKAGKMTFKHPPSATMLGYNDPDSNPEILGLDGNYTTDYSNKLKFITPEWFNTNRSLIDEEVKNSNSGYKIKDYQDFLDKSQDKKLGLIHNLVNNFLNYDGTPRITEGTSEGNPFKKVGSGLTTSLKRPTSSIVDPRFKFEGSGVGNYRFGDANKKATSFNTGLNTSLTNPVHLDYKGADKGMGSKDIETKKGLWNSFLEGIKGYNVDGTDLSNIAMYASTVGANRRIGNLQLQGNADSIYSRPYMAHNYLRIDKRPSQIAIEQADKLLGGAGRLSRSIADIDKSVAINLSGNKQARELLVKGEMDSLTRADKLEGLQQQSNAAINEYNTTALGKNRAIFAEAATKDSLIKANRINAQNTAFGNIVRALDKNRTVKEYKDLMGKYMTDLDDPNIKTKTDAYTWESGTDGEKAARDIYEANKKAQVGTTYKAWEDSTERLDWQTRIKNALDAVQIAYEPLKKKQAAISFQRDMLQFSKKGGTMSKRDKEELENVKYNHRRRLKEVELEYKAIMHNNEMLQKSLIKVFK